MGKIQSCMYVVCLLCSATLNILFVGRYVYVSGKWEVGWSRRAAEEAEAAAAVSCSGHGRAYLDGLVVDGSPVCECNTCFGGPDCSQFSASCVADVDSGDPLFLEPFWMQHAASSALLVAGWHRMSYSFPDHSLISKELEELIRKLHAIVGNANTTGRFIVFGAGSIQLLNAAVHALSPHNSSAPAKVVATIPFYPVYKSQTDFFRSVDFQFVGDTSLWKNTSDTTSNLIEFVTAPNNPDGKLNKAVLQGPNAKPIYDHAYYWPHFTPIPAPADEDLMIFTFSKLTGHAGSRFGWALIKDKDVYETMSNYMSLNVDGVSRDTQLRAFKLLKVVTRGRGREIFEFGYKTMKDRWEKLNRALLMSRRFSVQESSPQYCTFSGKVKRPSPAYAWLKCEKERKKRIPEKEPRDKMQCAVAVASSPVFSPSRVSSVFCKSSVSSPDLRKLNLLRSPPPLTPSSSLSLPASPRLHKQEIVHKEFQEGLSVAPTTASKRKRPAKLSIPIIPACCFAVDSPARVERLDEVEVEGEGYSVYCKRGRRAAMEDRYSADVDLGGDSKQAFFGVFDGHGGAIAADFAAKNITKNVMAEVTKKGDEGIEVAIKNGYLATDAEFLKEDVSGGSCCVTALIREGELHVSNAGDCRAVMSRGGIAEALTSDHRPSREDEMDRIQTLGGYVDRCRGVWRIQGSLAVSRGIGDRNLKQWVTAEPETKSLKIKPECEFLILASDGLWDKVTNQEAVDVVRPLCIGVDKPEPFSACKNLARLAIRRGSTDDISVMVIQLSHFLS